MNTKKDLENKCVCKDWDLMSSPPNSQEPRSPPTGKGKENSGKMLVTTSFHDWVLSTPHPASALRGEKLGKPELPCKSKQREVFSLSSQSKKSIAERKLRLSKKLWIASGACPVGTWRFLQTGQRAASALCTTQDSMRGRARSWVFCAPRGRESGRMTGPVA